MSTVEAKADLVADTIIGTVKSVADGLFLRGFDPGLENNADFCGQIDNRLFICEECGWTCDRSEESTSHPDHCDECRPNDGTENDDD